MLWRQTEDRWAKERRRTPGGTQRAEASAEVLQRTLGAEGCLKRDAAEPRLLADQGLGCPAQSIRASGPRSRTLAAFNFSQRLRERNCTRRGKLRGVLRRPLYLLVRAVYPPFLVISRSNIASDQPTLPYSSLSDTPTYHETFEAQLSCLPSPPNATRTVSTRACTALDARR